MKRLVNSTLTTSSSSTLREYYLDSRLSALDADVLMSKILHRFYNAELRHQMAASIVDVDGHVVFTVTGRNGQERFDIDVYYLTDRLLHVVGSRTPRILCAHQPVSKMVVFEVLDAALPAELRLDFSSDVPAPLYGAYLKELKLVNSDVEERSLLERLIVWILVLRDITRLYTAIHCPSHRDLVKRVIHMRKQNMTYYSVYESAGWRQFKQSRTHNLSAILTRFISNRYTYFITPGDDPIDQWLLNHTAETANTWPLSYFDQCLVEDYASHEILEAALQLLWLYPVTSDLPVSAIDPLRRGLDDLR